MTRLSFPQRIRMYLKQIGLSIAVPFICIMIMVAILGERQSGLAYGLIVSLLTLNFYFAYKFLRSGLIKILVTGIISTVTSVGATFFVMNAELKFNFDYYGVWTGLMVYAATTIITWEIIYHILTILIHKRQQPLIE